MIEKCKVCGKELKAGKLCCSFECYCIYKTKNKEKACAACGKVYKPRCKTSKYCSQECKKNAMTQENEINVLPGIDYCIMYIKDKRVLFDKEDLELVRKLKWCLDRQGYVIANNRRQAIKSGKKSILLHRLIMNFPEGEQIDHIDRNPLNNQKKNLRICSNFENCLNKENLNATPGVSWNKENNKWRAYINKNGKYIHLGNFSDKEQAKKARIEAENKYFNKQTA
jgi:hypothetical protein